MRAYVVSPVLPPSNLPQPTCTHIHPCLLHTPICAYFITPSHPPSSCWHQASSLILSLPSARFGGVVVIIIVDVVADSNRSRLSRLTQTALLASTNNELSAPSVIAAATASQRHDVGRRKNFLC